MMKAILLVTFVFVMFSNITQAQALNKGEDKNVFILELSSSHRIKFEIYPTKRDIRVSECKTYEVDFREYDWDCDFITEMKQDKFEEMFDAKKINRILFHTVRTSAATSGAVGGYVISLGLIFGLNRITRGLAKPFFQKFVSEYKSTPGFFEKVTLGAFGFFDNSLWAVSAWVMQFAGGASGALSGLYVFRLTDHSRELYSSYIERKLQDGYENALDKGVASKTLSRSEFESIVGLNFRNYFMGKLAEADR